MKNSSVLSKLNIQASQNTAAILFERSNKLFTHISDAALGVSVCALCRCRGGHEHMHAPMCINCIPSHVEFHVSY